MNAELGETVFGSLEFVVMTKAPSDYQRPIWFDSSLCIRVMI